MDGKELFSRLISTLQETAMKIGDSSGSISLYYPFQGDFSTLEDEFRSASADFPDMIIEDLPERGERCRRCIAYRLRKAGAKARELSCDMFTTTLTISPHKDCTFINECGAQIQDECGVAYLFSDFKKHDGYKHSIELSRQYNLYRQNYCGCIYSKR